MESFRENDFFGNFMEICLKPITRMSVGFIHEELRRIGMGGRHIADRRYD